MLSCPIRSSQLPRYERHCQQGSKHILAGPIRAMPGSPPGAAHSFVASSSSQGFKHSCKVQSCSKQLQNRNAPTKNWYPNTPHVSSISTALRRSLWDRKILQSEEETLSFQSSFFRCRTFSLAAALGDDNWCIWIKQGCWMKNIRLGLWFQTKMKRRI